MGQSTGPAGLYKGHDKLKEMQKSPVVIVHHEVTRIVKVVAGENHLVMLSADGEVLTFGDGSMGQLGRSYDTSRIRSTQMVSERCLKVGVMGVHHTPSAAARRSMGQVRFVDVFAGGFWSMAQAATGEVYAWGLNNFHQLGITRDDEDTLNGQADDMEINRVCRPFPSKAFQSHRKWSSIAGVQHVVCRDESGSIYAMGRNIDNALGLGNWTGNEDTEHWRYDTLQQVTIPGERAVGADASLGGSLVWTDNGNVYSFGYDTVGQLGLGIVDEDEKMVAAPQRVRSNHLEGYRVVEASISDSTSLFLAAKL